MAETKVPGSGNRVLVHLQRFWATWLEDPDCQWESQTSQLHFKNLNKMLVVFWTLVPIFKRVHDVYTFPRPVSQVSVSHSVTFSNYSPSQPCWQSMSRFLISWSSFALLLANKATLLAALLLCSRLFKINFKFAGQVKSTEHSKIPR